MVAIALAAMLPADLLAAERRRISVGTEAANLAVGQEIKGQREDADSGSMV